MLEFALVLPVLLLLIFGIIEFARAFQAWLVISNAARFGVRYAVTGEYDYSQYCDPTNPPIASDLNGSGKACKDEDGTNWPGNPNPSDAQIRQQRNDEVDNARLFSIHDVTEGLLVGILQDTTAPQGTPGHIKVSVCSSQDGYLYMPWPDDYCRGPSGSEEEHPGNPRSETGRRVTVYITYEHPIILPFLNTIMPSVRLHAERTGILENFRVARVLALPPASTCRPSRRCRRTRLRSLPCQQTPRFPTASVRSATPCSSEKAWLNSRFQIKTSLSGI